MIKARAHMVKSQKIEILFVTGKGGVGKSAAAAALALKKSQKGLRTLLVELGNQSFYQDYFNLEKVVYQPQNLKPNLDVALWSGPDCLREYALHLLKIESLYRLFFENPVTKALVSIAPGLPELSILGKITSGPPRFVGPNLPYDCLVVDAYATGHFLALLRAPFGMASAVRFGPMADQSRAIDRVLKDASICKYYIVTLAEDLPVTETLELASAIEKQIGLKPNIVLNKILPIETEKPDDKSAPEFSNAMERIRKDQAESRARLKAFSVKTLPFVFANDSWKVTETLAEEFADV